MVHSFNYSFVQSSLHSFNNAFILLFIRLFIPSSIHSLIYRCVYLFADSFLHSVFYPFILSFNHSFTCWFLTSFVHSFFHPPFCVFIHSLVNLSSTNNIYPQCPLYERPTLGAFFLMWFILEFSLFVLLLRKNYDVDVNNSFNWFLLITLVANRLYYKPCEQLAPNSTRASTSRKERTAAAPDTSWLWKLWVWPHRE